MPGFLGGELPVHEPPAALVGGSAKAICWGTITTRTSAGAWLVASSVVIHATIAMLRARANAGHPDAAY